MLWATAIGHGPVRYLCLPNTGLGLWVHGCIRISRPAHYWLWVRSNLMACPLGDELRAHPLDRERYFQLIKHVTPPGLKVCLVVTASPHIR